MPSPLAIQLDSIPRVNAAAGGGPTLVNARDRLLELACPPPERPKPLPIVGQTIPKLWEAAIACVHAVRTGRDCTAEARAALLGRDPHVL